MPDIVLNTSSATLSELIGNSKIYIVPPYQRDYSWEDEEWEDLWLDIIGLQEEGIHYMGYVVFQSGDKKRLQIIDGQQRFATLSIIALAVIKILEKWIKEGISPQENEERKELLRSKFLGHKDPASLIPTSKLILNRNNDDFFRSYLLRLRTPANISKLKPSERRLWKAFEYFYKKIEEYFSDSKSGEELSKFLNERIADNLIFTTINVSDDLNAYKVFETLNARGVKLSTTDLLKNFLFSIVAQNSDVELEEVERQWQNINNLLGVEDFPTFLRHYWNSKNRLERKQTLFKTIKKSIPTADDVFSILKKLEDLAPVYSAFSRPADDLWDKEQSKHIDALSLFSVTQCYSLLLAAYGKIDKSEFVKLLRDCVVISFRYSVIGGLNPNTLEIVYNKAAIKVSGGQITTAREIFNELKEVYISDESFKNSFASKTINSKRNRKLLRYILFGIENQISGKDDNYEDSKATIEHIVPENPTEEWEILFSQEEQEVCVYRLGNYTLLETKKNSESGRRIYSEKIEIYKNSSYKLTNPDSIYEDWTPVILRKRQEKIANYATSVWKINY